ncbi:hypothetical protein HZH68_005852 [Vespula germanica]|uniref:Uncharacterized protein n=1 Tax=Vespula germanica TaxID=30212 RepID=A0A834KGX7_VESGE|nr:hypothetical protein HZH68_005852 [Vespula germanica]
MKKGRNEVQGIETSLYHDPAGGGGGGSSDGGGGGGEEGNKEAQPMTILRREIFNTSFISELKVKDNVSVSNINDFLEYYRIQKDLKKTYLGPFTAITWVFSTWYYSASS